MKKVIILAFLLAMQLGAMAGNLVSDNFGKIVKVKGTPGIVSFVQALLNTSPNGWDQEATYDKKNGFFHYFEEGGGGIEYYVCIWNRTDGKKLVIVSYKLTDFGSPVKTVSTPWTYRSSYSIDTGAGKENINQETGFCAYLYNKEKKQLVPMTTPPFKGFVSPLNAHYKLVLPQKGKNIVVIEGVQDNIVEHTLKFNGLTFNYVK